MSGAIDLTIAHLQQTAQILEKLGITEVVKMDGGGRFKDADKRIEDYAEHFRALYKVIQEPLGKDKKIKSKHLP